MLGAIRAGIAANCQGAASSSTGIGAQRGWAITATPAMVSTLAFLAVEKVCPPPCEAASLSWQSPGGIDASGPSSRTRFCSTIRSGRQPLFARSPWTAAESSQGCPFPLNFRVSLEDSSRMRSPCLLAVAVDACLFPGVIKARAGSSGVGIGQCLRGGLRRHKRHHFAPQVLQKREYP